MRTGSAEGPQPLVLSQACPEPVEGKDGGGLGVSPSCYVPGRVGGKNSAAIMPAARGEPLEAASLNGRQERLQLLDRDATRCLDRCTLPHHARDEREARELPVQPRPRRGLAEMARRLAGVAELRPQDPPPVAPQQVAWDVLGQKRDDISAVIERGERPAPGDRK